MGYKPDHKRIKPKRVRPPNAAEKRHIERIVEKRCLVCRRAAEYHHIHSDGFGRVLKDHRFGAPLCPDHHRGKLGIHMLGHDGFVLMYGIDLYQWAHAEWAESQLRELRAA